MANVKWSGVDDIMQNMNTHEKRIGEACFQIAQYYAPQMETYAKENAPWTDRTANARQSLYAVPEREGDKAVVRLSHGVRYGLWLEIRSDGRYAIIWPTVEHFMPDIRRMVKQVFS